MVLQRWSPISDVRRMEDSLGRLWRLYGRRPVSHDGEASWGMALDVVQGDDNIVIQASLPGVAPEDIKVTIEDGVLAVEGKTEVEDETNGNSYLVRERRTGSFHRSLRLPDTVDTEKAESRYENGVLSISFPKQEAKKARQIEVKAGS